MGEDNEIDLQEVEWGGMDWIGASQNRDRSGALVNTVMNNVEDHLNVTIIY